MSSRRNVRGRSRRRREPTPEDEEEIEVPLTALDPAFYGIQLSNVIHQQNFIRLARLRIVPSRFPDDHAMQELGISEDVWRLFDRVGWKYALKNPHKTYAGITLEVLSTLSVRKGKHSMPVEATFQLNNQSHTWTDEDINDVFHVPPNGFYHANVTTPMWADMADADEQPYQANRAKATRIRNPVLRYIHRILAMSVLARGDNGGVRQDEIRILWGMLGSSSINFGAFLLGQLESQARLTSGSIAIGGMLTPIALAIGMDLGDVPCVEGPILLDIRSLEAQHMIRPAGDSWLLSQKAGDFFPLPNPALTTVSDLYDRQNWKMDTPAHQALVVRDTGDGFPPRTHRDRAESSTQGGRRSTSHEGMDDLHTWQDGMSRRMCQVEADIQVMRGDVTFLRNAQFEQRQAQIEQTEMLRLMHQWHISQGHYPPPPP